MVGLAKDKYQVLTHPWKCLGQGRLLVWGLAFYIFYTWIGYILGYRNPS